jgi:hypothetical protein
MEEAMTNEDTPAVPISNWTLATATKPGARHVYPPPTKDTSRRTEPYANQPPA